MLKNAHVPILGFAALSGTGKTTLLRELLPALKHQGLRVAVVKHAHHSFDVDQPGKDSYELRKAGAAKMLVASRMRWALMAETNLPERPRLDDLLAQLHQDDLDLILVEGFKAEQFPKIELHRPSLGHPLLFPEDDAIIAIASDAPLGIETRLPILDINRLEALAGFILQQVAAESGQKKQG